MKIRNGFVSNSSSSSFIVYINSKNKEKDYSQYLAYMEKTYIPYAAKGKKCYSITLPLKDSSSHLNSFGWEFKRWGSFIDKVNYLFLQIHELNTSTLYTYMQSVVSDMHRNLNRALNIILERALGTDNTYLSVKVDYNTLYCDSISEDTIGIDHQSLWEDELPSGLNEKRAKSFFEDNYPWVLDPEAIVDYLTGDSYIQGGNDNETYTYDWNESYWKVKNYLKQIQEARKEVQEDK